MRLVLQLAGSAAQFWASPLLSDQPRVIVKLATLYAPSLSRRFRSTLLTHCPTSIPAIMLQLECLLRLLHFATMFPLLRAVQNRLGQPTCKRERPQWGKQEVSAEHHDLVTLSHSTVHAAFLTHLRSNRGVYRAMMLHWSSGLVSREFSTAIKSSKERTNRLYDQL